MKHKQDKNTAKIRKWIRAKPRTNLKIVNKVLEEKGYGATGITHALYAKDLSAARKKFVAKFRIK